MFLISLLVFSTFAQFVPSEEYKFKSEIEALYNGFDQDGLKCTVKWKQDIFWPSEGYIEIKHSKRDFFANVLAKDEIFIGRTGSSVRFDHPSLSIYGSYLEGLKNEILRFDINIKIQILGGRPYRVEILERGVGKARLWQKEFFCGSLSVD